MSDNLIIPVFKNVEKNSLCTQNVYRDKYKHSLDNPGSFWAEEGKRITWFKPYSKIKNSSFEGDISINWYEDGTLNACYN